MTRLVINNNIRIAIFTDIKQKLQFPTRQAIIQYAQKYNVPKQVVAGNISWLVRSG